MGLIERLALGAPPAVFPLVGFGGDDAYDALRLDPSIRVVSSPRSANVLVSLGGLPDTWLKPALRVHDQLSRPRGVICLEAEGAGNGVGRLFPQAEPRESGESPAAACRRVHAALISGEGSSYDARRPDVPPSRWRGVGPHGQGGEGMMGGRPYGRPMAMTGDDRDGLSLDRLELTLGPFFPPFPAGLTLDLVLQGDLVQEVRPHVNPFLPLADGSVGDPFTRALREPVPIAELELRRASDHLRWLARGLVLIGLDGLALRALRLSEACTRVASVGNLSELVAAVSALSRRVTALPVTTPAMRGVGRLGIDSVEEGWGPVARAAGLESDARIEDGAYTSLGFRPVLEEGGDARARWRQRAFEAAQSLGLAAAAGSLRRDPGGAVESPQGRLAPGSPVGGVPLDALGDLLAGSEWGDALVTLHSLGLDLDRSARYEHALSAPAAED